LTQDATKLECSEEVKKTVENLGKRHPSVYQSSTFEEVANKVIVICDIPFGCLKDTEHDQAWDQPKLMNFAQNCCNLAGEDGVVWIMCGDQQVSQVVHCFQGVHRWEKSYVGLPYFWVYNPPYNPKGFQAAPVRETIYILCFTRKPRNLNYKSSLKPNKFGQLIFCKRPKGYLTVEGETTAYRSEEKPTALIAELIHRCSWPSAGHRGTVVDLTQGSGTTGEVALTLGFLYIGNDLSPTPKEVVLRLCRATKARKKAVEDWVEELQWKMGPPLLEGEQAVPVGDKEPCFGPILSSSRASAQDLVQRSSHYEREIEDLEEEDREGHSAESESNSLEEELSEASESESSSGQEPPEVSGQGPPEEPAQEGPAVGHQKRPILNKGKEKPVQGTFSEKPSKFQREVQTLKATRARIRTRAGAAKR
jgi:hypothetical protein